MSKVEMRELKDLIRKEFEDILAHKNAEIDRLNYELIDIAGGAARWERRALDAEAKLKAIVDAWEVLPGGKNYYIREIEEWLINDMKPAIDKARDNG